MCIAICTLANSLAFGIVTTLSFCMFGYFTDVRWHSRTVCRCVGYSAVIFWSMARLTASFRDMWFGGVVMSCLAVYILYRIEVYVCKAKTNKVLVEHNKIKFNINEADADLIRKIGEANNLLEHQIALLEMRIVQQNDWSEILKSFPGRTKEEIQEELKNIVYKINSINGNE